MSGKKQKPIKLDELTKEEKLKYEIADELGLLDQIMEKGWRSLSSKETGKIGGMIAKRKRALNKSNENITNVNLYEKSLTCVENAKSLCYNAKKPTM